MQLILQQHGITQAQAWEASRKADKTMQKIDMNVDKTKDLVANYEKELIEHVQRLA